MKLNYCFYFKLYLYYNKKVMKEIEIEDVEVIDNRPLNKNKKSKDCKSCKDTGLGFGHWTMVILGFYIVFSSIYGTIQLIKDIF
jgi:hypothetical protein